MEQGVLGGVHAPGTGWGLVAFQTSLPHNPFECSRAAFCVGSLDPSQDPQVPLVFLLPRLCPSIHSGCLA